MFTTFTLKSLSISNTRSLHNDTDFVYISVTVGANPPVFGSKSLGDLTTEPIPSRSAFKPISPMMIRPSCSAT